MENLSRPITIVFFPRKYFNNCKSVNAFVSNIKLLSGSSVVVNFCILNSVDFEPTVNSRYNEPWNDTKKSLLYREFVISKIFNKKNFNGKNLLLYQERDDRTKMLVIHRFYQELWSYIKSYIKNLLKKSLKKVRNAILRYVLNCTHFVKFFKTVHIFTHFSTEKDELSK